MVIAGRRQDRRDEIVAARPGLEAVQLDRDGPAALSRSAEAARKHFPELSVLMANAGSSRTEDMAADGWSAADAEAVVSTNVLGALRVTAAVLGVLKRHRDGMLTVTTSDLAFMSRADVPSSCASKAFLHPWLQPMRRPLRRVPPEVLELSPSSVATEPTGPMPARQLTTVSSSGTTLRTWRWVQVLAARTRFPR